MVALSDLSIFPINRWGFFRFVFVFFSEGIWVRRLIPFFFGLLIFHFLVHFCSALWSIRIFCWGIIRKFDQVYFLFDFEFGDQVGKILYSFDLLRLGDLEPVESSKLREHS